MSAVVCAEAGFPHIIIELCTAYYNTCYIACYVIRADNIMCLCTCCEQHPR